MVTEEQWAKDIEAAFKDGYDAGHKVALAERYSADQLAADEELNTRIDQVYTTMNRLHCTEDEARQHLGLPEFNE